MPTILRSSGLEDRGGLGGKGPARRLKAWHCHGGESGVRGEVEKERGYNDPFTAHLRVQEREASKKMVVPGITAGDRAQLQEAVDWKRFRVPLSLIKTFGRGSTARGIYVGCCNACRTTEGARRTMEGTSHLKWVQLSCRAFTLFSIIVSPTSLEYTRASLNE